MTVGRQEMPAGSGSRWLVAIDEAGNAGVPTPVPDGSPTPTSTIVTNGIRMGFERAVDAMASMVNKADSSVRSFTLLYNPTEGFFRDGVETLADRMGFTTSIAKQWAWMLREAQVNGKFLAVVFSQGGAVNASAVSYINATAGGPLSNMSLVCYGCANNVLVSKDIFAAAGVNTDPSNVRYVSNINDPVANLFSLSTLNPVRLILSILSALFVVVPGMDPHAY
jgi:hypothetical protein